MSESYWRCANKRRKPVRAMEPYLGDCIELEPLREVVHRPRKPLDVVKAIKAAVVASSGAILVCLVLFALFMAVMATRPAKAEPDERQVRRDCRIDALRYCPAEASRCLVKEDDRCRFAIIACIRAKRDRLRPMCAQHIY